MAIQCQIYEIHFCFIIFGANSEIPQCNSSSAVYLHSHVSILIFFPHGKNQMEALLILSHSVGKVYSTFFELCWNVLQCELGGTRHLTLLTT